VWRSRQNGHQGLNQRLALSQRHNRTDCSAKAFKQTVSGDGAGVPVIEAPPLVVQRDDGLWSIGWHDEAPGPFETRTFAASVAAQARRAQVRQ
jgi:hypothetical protein